MSPYPDAGSEKNYQAYNKKSFEPKFPPTYESDEEPYVPLTGKTGIGEKAKLVKSLPKTNTRVSKSVKHQNTITILNDKSPVTQLISKKEFPNKSKANPYESPPLRTSKAKTKGYVLSKEKLVGVNLTDKGHKEESKDFNRDSLPRFVHYNPSDY